MFAHFEHFGTASLFSIEGTNIFQDYEVDIALTAQDKKQRRKGEVLPGKAHHFSIGLTEHMPVPQFASSVDTLFHSPYQNPPPNSKPTTSWEEVEEYRPHTGVALPAPADRALLVVANALQDLQAKAGKGRV